MGRPSAPFRRSGPTLVAPDPEMVMGEQRALFRVADLLELARLVDRLLGHDSAEAFDGV